MKVRDVSSINVGETDNETLIEEAPDDKHKIQ
jgi:hypothetical protein